jgi:hypothetical protein
MAVERIESDRFPFLPMRATVNDRTVEAMALLDTGFDGDLVVPLAEIAGGQPPDEYRIWSLADGSEVETPIYYGSVQVGGFPPLDADIAGLGDEAIVGRGVGDHYRIILEHGQHVIVEP